MWRPCRRLRSFSSHVTAAGTARCAFNSQHHDLTTSATLLTTVFPRRRKLQCLRGAYHASRAVAQLLLPLLQPTRATLGYMGMTGAMKSLATSLEGSPVSLEHEGPLQDKQLIAIRDLATSATVTDLRNRLLNNSLCHREATRLAASLWSEKSMRSYQATLLAARQARLDAGRSFNGYDHLKEAGAAMRRAMCSNAAEPETCAEWARLIDLYTSFLPDRSHIHELENLPQEIAIGELLRETVERVRRADDEANGNGFALDCVVDVGGGNGFLAAQVAERLQCDSVVIDPFFPAHSIDCCPRVWPDTVQRTRPATRRQRTLHRTMALFRDVRWFDAVPAAPARTALIAKHLCGSGVDEVLRHLEAQKCLPRILVLAPCCFNKITFEKYCDAAYLRQVMGIDSDEALARVSRLTDWNMSCYQSTHEHALSVVEAARRKLTTTHRRCGREVQRSSEAAASHALPEVNGSSANAAPLFCHQRRSGPRSIANSITCTHEFAVLVEGLLNYGRVQWLRQRHYDVQLVQYVPNVVTPKNTCFLAMRQAYTS
ncbi:methyltransferase domain containing protein, putative [Leishmania tarentolae]|uniref:tRNA:m(4)X modification enzyme TRM13 n=1 Tax=Leishmania tarentolae TaxID=5689 RepID=A0A640KHF1_LEITA|nr:methyltransferase domain containing protein, putative [Leishmania tarentolae]